MVSELLECTKAYGYCGFETEANRLWREIYDIACGINYRKDYQFNEAIDALERAHKVNSDKSLSRLSKLLHLAHQLIGTGQGRIPAIAIQSLMAFACNINLELALELLHQEDAHISRESGIREIVNSAISVTTINKRYLWSIIKTMDKWDDFNVYNEITYPTIFDLFETVIISGEFDLASEIYNFCKHQFLVEKDRPEGVYDLAELCQKHCVSINSSSQDLGQFKTAKDEFTKRASQQTSSLLKESRESNLLDFNEIHLKSEENFGSFECEVEKINRKEVIKNRKKNLKRNYYILKQMFTDWYDQQSSIIKEQIDLKSIAIYRSYLQFIQDVCELPIKIRQSEYHQSVSRLFGEFRSSVQNIIPGFSLVEYVDSMLDLQDWVEQISRREMTLFDSRLEFPEIVYNLIENSSLENLANWEQFCRKWLKHNQLTKTLLQIAHRIKRLDKIHSQELLIEAWNVNSDFFFDYGGSAEEFFTFYFEVAPDLSKKLLLQSFYLQHRRYPSSIIYNLKILTHFANQFENEEFYDYMYTQYEQHNELLTLGLSEKPTNYNWVENFKPKYSPGDATIQYLVRLFDYPEVEVRKLALASLFDLILSDGTVLERVLSFCETLSANCKEHSLSLAYSVAIAKPERILLLKSSLIRWLEFPHFNVKQTAKEILLYCANQSYMPFEQWEIEKILITNTRPQILMPTLIEGELHKGRKFLPSKYQSNLMYKFYDENSNDEFLNKIYTHLLYDGWTTENGMNLESEVHRRHNINSNFDDIEINGPYFQAVQEIINTLLEKGIKERAYDDYFIEEIKHDFRLYDPSDLITETRSRPSTIDRVDKSLSNEQFLDFEDLTNISDGWRMWDDEWIVLYENGHQRLGDRYSPDTNRTCYFTLIPFLASYELDQENVNLNSLHYSPFVQLENIYRHEVPYVLQSNKSHPIPGVRPIIGISKRIFRGQDDLSIAALLPDFADELKLVPTNSLNYKFTDNIALKFIQWQDKYDQGRRRQKPFAAGVRLQIKRQILQNYLERGHWNIHYFFYSRRSTDKYSPEEDMKWVSFEQVGKFTLSNNKISWI